MNLSFKQAIDLHQCLRYIEACQEAIYGNDNTSDNIEVGDVSVTFHFDDGETFLDSLIVSATEMARRLGITKSIIIRVCLGIRKSYRGCNLFYECDSDKWMKLIKE